MSKFPIEYLRHIQDECRYLAFAVPANYNYTNFVQDETLKRAVVRSLEIIGEASKKIPADLKVQWNEIQWKHMSGMRDRLIHDYMGVNYIIVWEVVTQRIPVLLKHVDAVIQSLEGNR